MNHLIISREYPPSAYPAGGIATYVEHISRLLAEQGETVHVIGEQWDGASEPRETRCGGRLVIHRVPLARPLGLPAIDAAPGTAVRTLEAMAASEFPAQGFSWQAALLAESLVETAGIDVIEAQDYEAPLYYFLLRRALGLGPARRPPCIVHLHSPTEFVWHHNDWEAGTASIQTMTRLETHAIAAADALLCPSRYLAGQVEARYGIESGVIERIPYPIGQTPLFERPSLTWRDGTICYVGRLEPRKGVLEWIDAAVAVAAGHPGLRFEFIGADTPLSGAGGTSVRAALEARVPDRLKGSFAFTGPRPRWGVWQRLESARLVVVPSRWENFPNTCVEAMCSGLPVLASPEGGMAEMIEDGTTGWLAASVRPADLAEALRRALETPPGQLAEMGRLASDAIRTMCDNQETLARHLEYKGRLVRQGAARSLRAPAVRTWTPLPVAPPAAPASGARRVRTPALDQASSDEGVAIVVAGVPASGLHACLESITRQTRAPSAVVVVADRPDDAGAWRAWQLAHGGGWRMVERGGASLEAARRLGVRAALEGPARPLGLAIVDAGCRLEPEFVEACQSILELDDRIGVVSSWSGADDGGIPVPVRPCPQLPYQWIQDDASPCCTIRTAALDGLEWVWDVAGGAPASGDLVLAVLAERWAAVTYPAFLSRRADPLPPEHRGAARAARARVRQALAVRDPERFVEDVPLVLQTLERLTPLAAREAATRSFTPRSVLRLPVADQWRLASRALRNPRYAANWIAWHVRRSMLELGERMARVRTGVHP